MNKNQFVSRKNELKQLSVYLDRALSGEGQVCFISGEAGTGKTALSNEFSRIVQEKHAELIVAFGNCNAQTGIGDSYLPFREILEILTGDVEIKLSQGNISKENASRIKGFLSNSGKILIDVAPDLIETLIPGGKLIGAMGKAIAQKIGLDKKVDTLFNEKINQTDLGQNIYQQSHIFEQYTKYLIEVSKKHPLIIMVDDLQWADVASSGLLFHLGRRLAGSRILIIGTFRPVEIHLERRGEPHPMSSVLNEFQRYYGNTTLDLGSVNPADKKKLVEEILDLNKNILGEEFRAILFEQTGGNPLYTVELLKDMRESGDLVKNKFGKWEESEGLNWNELPARVEGVIERRIGRLEAFPKEALTIASLQGEEFNLEVLAKMLGKDIKSLIRIFSGEIDKVHQLVLAQGVKRVGLNRVSVYRFRHNLFQKYLYNSLDPVERVYWHEELANNLEILYEENIDKIAIKLAHHFQEAQIPEKAVQYLLEAGEQAIKLSAQSEAIILLYKGLDLIGELPKSESRDQLELQYNIALGIPLQVINGPGAIEVGKVYSKARELSKILGQETNLIQSLWGLWRYYRSRADFNRAQTLADELISLTDKQEDTALILQAHHAQWTTLIYIGKFSRALEHINAGLSIYSPKKHHSDASIFSGHDLGVCAHTMAAFTLWFLGYPDQALEKAKNGLDLADKLSHPPSIALALEHLAGVHRFRKEPVETQKVAQTLMTLAEEQGSAYDKATGLVLHGWSLVELNNVEEGLKQIKEGMAIRRPKGTGLEDAHIRSILIEALEKNGEFEKGLGLIDELLDDVNLTGQKFWEAELWRMKGKLSVLKGNEERNAEESFLKALKISEEQDAKSFNLRILINYYHLFNNKEEVKKQYSLLSDAINWFTEGFETTDLKEARKLLESRFK